jgi:hexosaminidase
MLYEPTLIPRPQELVREHGTWRLVPDSRLVAHGDAAAVAALLADYLRPATGFALPVVDGPAGAADIVLATSGTPQPDDAGFVDERYTCAVAPDGVRLEAVCPAGLARAIQTLRQLFPPAIFAATAQADAWELPCVRIADAPRFRWRGLHLDVCRHCFTVAEVERFIELLALHRFNRLHLHLTEDQGWRIEIKKFPRLTEIGSRRACTLVGSEGARPRVYDDTPYGGFYTQDELRGLVAFAARRHVEIVPEIDMPGHMQAAIAAYPELGNTGEALSPRCHWGISHHILNVEEATVLFMQDVLDEVMAIFPGRFIHVGGDEAVKLEWQESRRVQERMRELGVANEHALQSWFIRRMDDFITSRGRRLIGWDEILEGGLAAGAAVMSWRGEAGGIEAATQGHDVVMAPCQYVYFDHYQAEPTAEEPLAIGGMSTTEHVYAYEPIPAALPAARHPHVLGAQGQLWTEYIGDLPYLDYMTYPRACALSEVVWLAPEQKCYADFLARLGAHRERLAALGVNAHPRP